MGMITSRKISCTIDDELVNDKLVTFSAPCDSAGVTAVVINGTEFELVDSTCKAIGSIGNVFASGSKITLCLDVTNSKAYIMNAANTNAVAVKRIDVDNETYNVNLTLEDSAEYFFYYPVNTLALDYPKSGSMYIDFECWMNFIAGSAFVLNAPKHSRVIGTIPDFTEGNSYELSIKNGVLVFGEEAAVS